MFNKARLYFAKRGFESDLSAIIGLADGHKAVGVPAGAGVYRTLLNRANDDINKYIATTAKLSDKAASMAEIEAAAPRLRELRALANGLDTRQVTARYYAKLYWVSAFALFMSGLLFSTMLGIWHDLYLYVAHFAKAWGLV